MVLHSENDRDNKTSTKRVIFIIIAAAIIFVGGIFTWFEQVAVTEEVKTELLKQGNFIKEAINVRTITALKTTCDDYDTDEYKRLEKQLKLTKDLFSRYKNMYFLTRNDEKDIIYFINANNPSQKGEPYENQSEKLHGVFSENKTESFIIQTGEESNVNTLFLPVPNKSGNVDIILAIDANIGEISSTDRERIIVPIIFTITVLILFIITVNLIKWKKRLPPEKAEKRFPRYLEPILLAIFGLLLTVMLSYVASYRQSRMREDVFVDIAEGQAKLLVEELRHFRDYKIESIAHFFESSEYVSREEFSSYVEFLTYSEMFSDWAWTPIIKENELDEMIELAKKEVKQDFAIWKKDEDGNKTNVPKKDKYYPILFIEPFEENKELVGFDISSEPAIAEPMRNSLDSGLQTASELFDISVDSEINEVLAIIRPVISGEKNKQEGLVLSLINPRTLIKELIGFSVIGETSVALGLYQLNENGLPMFFGSSVGKHKADENVKTEVLHYPDKEFNLIVPLFAFGEVYTVVAHPSEEFNNVYPLRSGWMVFFLGLLLTGYLTTTIGFLSNRGFYLRREVDEKTTELRNALDKLRNTMEASISALASTVEMRDPYTAGHQINVSKLSVAIAEKMELDPEKIEGLKLAARVHDIGKVQIPAEILTTPRKLTDLEYKLIKSHPEAGYNLFKNLDFPWSVDEIIFQHHERLDGSGYPRGLKGNEIMIEAKILGVADVVEAMSSHRPYRPSLGIDAALEEIEKNKGKLYDPDVVDACIELFRKDGFSFEEK
jgi:putative nucleotidyltransferase with HDIG domain